jgi:hypothetical protein
MTRKRVQSTRSADVNSTNPGATMQLTMASKPRRLATVPALGLLAALALTALGQDVDRTVTVHFVYSAALATSVPVPDRWTVYDDRFRGATVMLPPELIVHGPFIRIENLAGEKPQVALSARCLPLPQAGFAGPTTLGRHPGSYQYMCPGGFIGRAWVVLMPGSRGGTWRFTYWGARGISRGYLAPEFTVILAAFTS